MYASDIQIFDFHLRRVQCGEKGLLPPHPPPHISGVFRVEGDGGVCFGGGH